MSTLCIAHRGASAEAPENTLKAFERAIRHGADGIELDVQVTREGVPMVFHDDTLLRLTGARGRIGLATRADLRDLRVGGAKIPTLLETLELARGRVLLQIEIKPGVDVAPVLKAIRAAGVRDGVILASFDREVLRAAALAAATLPRMLIVDAPRLPVAPAVLAGRMLGAMAAVGAGGLSVGHRAIRAEAFVHAVRRHGAQLWCWTVNAPARMRTLQGWGVDAILSDDPRLLIATVRRAAGPAGFRPSTPDGG